MNSVTLPRVVSSVSSKPFRILCFTKLWYDKHEHLMIKKNQEVAVVMF